MGEPILFPSAVRVTECWVLTSYDTGVVCSYPMLPPMIKQENREQLHRGRAAVSMSTAPRDLAAIKHALELGLILATLIIATIMIVAAAHDDRRKPTPDITIGQVMFTLKRCRPGESETGVWPV
jgi:hypothetical protein